MAAILDRSAVDSLGEKGQHTGRPPGCLAQATHYPVHPAAALGGRGPRAYCARRAAQLREAKRPLRGHTAGRGRGGWAPACLTSVSVSSQPAFLGAAEVGRQVGLGNTETCELRGMNTGGVPDSGGGGERARPQGAPCQPQERDVWAGESWKPHALGAGRQLEAHYLPAGLHTEGLFRRSASVQTIREVQRLFNQGEPAPGDPAP